MEDGAGKCYRKGAWWYTVISILLVEDEPEKRRLLAETILSVPGVGPECVAFASDVSDAKRQLASRGFDLLLLDLNLPKRADQHPDPAGGVEVLRWLKGRGSPSRPRYIIGTSAYPDVLKAARGDFDNLIWALIQVEYSGNHWRAELVNSIKIIVGEKTPPYGSDGITYKTDILIVTALVDPELQSIFDLPLNWSPVSVQHDLSTYHAGRMALDEGSLDIVAVAASDKGLTAAGVAVTKGDLHVPAAVRLMAGICAGIKRRTSLGDVVIADLCWDWGSGKIKMEDGKEVFHTAPYQQRLDESLVLEQRRSSYAIAGLLIEGVVEALPPNKLKSAPRIHIGPVASGASVLQSSTAMQRVLKQHKDLLALEMEIFSVFFACNVAPLPRPGHSR